MGKEVKPSSSKKLKLQASDIPKIDASLAMIKANTQLNSTPDKLIKGL